MAQSTINQTAESVKNEIAIKTLNTTIEVTESGIANVFNVLTNEQTLVSIQIPDLTQYMFIPLKYATGRWFARGVNWQTFAPYNPGSTTTKSAIIKYFD